MSLLKVVIFAEILLMPVFFCLKKLNSKEARQASLSKKRIKNLKF